MTKRPRFSKTAIRKSRDLAVAIPIFWVILIMPPSITLFTGSMDVFGIPLVLMYILVVWLGGIAATAWNARRLADADETEAEGHAGSEGSVLESDP